MAPLAEPRRRAILPPRPLQARWRAAELPAWLVLSTP
jgi:hypothetical protein